MGAGYSIKAKANAEANILIYEDVGASFFGGVSAKQFADDLKGLGAVQTINLRLNSYGGEVFDGMAIYRQLVDHPARVVTHIDGVAASIASVIAMAGDEIRVAESGFVMIHNPHGIVIGEARDMRGMADTLDTLRSSIVDVYAARTKNKADDLRSWMDAETWFSGADAVENGFADSMVENMRVAARVDPEKHKFRHVPAALAGRPNYDAARDRLAQLRAQHEQRRIRELRAA